MSPFQSSLDAFFRGEAGLQELERALDRHSASPEEREAIVAAIEKAFSAGRLPTQLYQALIARVKPAASSLPGDPLQSTGMPRQDRPGDPVSASTASDNDPATERTVKEVPDEATLLSPVDATRIVAEATLRIPPPSRSSPSRADSSGRSVRPTGSNWSRPDQWQAKDQGPIQPGTVIKNRFTIESELGKGGMGVVFKARDARKEEARDDDPYVAIKILNDDFRNHPQALVALQREASKAQTLAHPNIVTVYDFDRDGTTVYMTMELMRGESLAERIRSARRGGVVREEALPVILEMAAGLAYAHKRNIVHSDFKPGNVFLTEDGRVKVLDFGIARATQHTGTSRSGKVEFDAGDLGALTPGYASLEMLNGEPAHPADDVYALSVTAYQLLTGEHPFQRRTAAEAAKEGLKPRPIKGLKRREWNAIAAGMQFRRTDRIQDAETFLRKFRGPRPITRSAVAAIVLLLGLSIYFAIPRDPEPLFPEESLPPEVRLDLSREIDDGNFYLDNDQPGFAFEHFHRAFVLHPNNPKALQGLKAIADIAIQDASAAASDKERSDRLEEIETYSSNEYLGDHKVLQEMRARLEKSLGE